MRAMLSGLADRLPDAKFTVLHQFNNPEWSCVPTRQDVRYLPIRIPIFEAVRLVLAALLLWLRIPVRGVAGRVGRQILDSYQRATAVVSAPGGPYFGDLYAGHEVVHWFFVWLGRVHGLPLALYAPSAGPFENRVLNPLRRRGFRWFDLVVLREERSARLLETLVPDLDVVVTVDSALQADPPDFQLARQHPRGGAEVLVVAAFRDPGTHRSRHDNAIVEALASLNDCVPTRVTLLPQVHGHHRDQPYLEALASVLMERGVEATVVDERADSEQQRALIADADIVLAGRYHPAVFAVAAEIPVLVIPYEHKAHGLAEAAGLHDWVLDVEDVFEERMREMVLKLHDRSHEVRRILEKTAPELREQAARTSELIAEMVVHRMSTAS